jgi:hypothetical protein
MPYLFKWCNYWEEKMKKDGLAGFRNRTVSSGIFSNKEKE